MAELDAVDVSNPQRWYVTATDYAAMTSMEKDNILEGTVNFLRPHLAHAAGMLEGYFQASAMNVTWGNTLFTSKQVVQVKANHQAEYFSGNPGTSTARRPPDSCTNTCRVDLSWAQSTAAPAGREMPVSQDAKSQAMVMETIMRTLAELLNPIIQPFSEPLKEAFSDPYLGTWTLRNPKS